MSTIYLDPAAMDATAGAIGEHAREVENVISGLEASCCADVPPHLAGWLAEELHDIALTSRLSALLYTVAALDTALRAQQISADQSLATAWPALDAPFGDLTTTPFGLQAALAGPTVVGGTDVTFDVSIPMPTSMTIGGDSTSTFPVSIQMPTSTTIGGTGPYTGSSDSSSAVVITVPPIDLDAFSGLSAPDLRAVMGVFDTLHDGVATWLAPNGLTVHDGLFVDSGGDVGTYSNVYRDPYVPGRYEVTP